MYSNEDFENFYVRYKAEALPKGVSIQSWCMKNKVSWNLFNKWYRDTRHRIVPVEVEGLPETEDSTANDGAANAEAAPTAGKAVRIMIDLRMTNGMQIRQKNLSYEALRSLVGNWRNYAEGKRDAQVLVCVQLPRHALQV